MSVKLTKALTLIGTVLLCLFVVYLGKSGYVSNPEKLEKMIKSFGILGPIIFILVQVIQVVIPIIPGGVSSAIGVIIFGPVFGFIYNYVGLMIGTYLAYILVKRYGKPFILLVVEQKTYDKYITWLNKGKKFEIFFALAIFLPGMPDDLLCMIAALTTMSLRKYMMINIICKPPALILYSLGVKEILLLISSLF